MVESLLVQVLLEASNFVLGPADSRISPISTPIPTFGLVVGNISLPLKTLKRVPFSVPTVIRPPPAP